ncbi:RS3A-like protein, partial [Mya arenaria]
MLYFRSKRSARRWWTSSPGSIGKDIEKACQGIYPLHDVYIRKVKVLKKPKFDLGKLMEMHGEGGSKTIVTETGEKIERTDNFEPPVLDSMATSVSSTRAVEVSAFQPITFAAEVLQQFDPLGQTDQLSATNLASDFSDRCAVQDVFKDVCFAQASSQSNILQMEDLLLSPSEGVSFAAFEAAKPSVSVTPSLHSVDVVVPGAREVVYIPRPNVFTANMDVIQACWKSEDQVKKYELIVSTQRSALQHNQSQKEARTKALKMAGDLQSQILSDMQTAISRLMRTNRQVVSAEQVADFARQIYGMTSRSYCFDKVLPDPCHKEWVTIPSYNISKVNRKDMLR